MENELGGAQNPIAISESKYVQTSYFNNTIINK